MRIRILSDLHREFGDKDIGSCEADVVVLAGDIDVGDKGLRWAQQVFPETPVIYVCGNHEHYRHALPKNVEALRTQAHESNIHVLENDSVVLSGVRFLGCTLWTDFCLLGDPRIAWFCANEQMTDYKQIRVSPEYRKLRTIDTASIHGDSVAWLKQTLARSKEPAVVVTHHAPSILSVPSEFRHDLLSAAYASNLDGLVEESKATLWVHGHVHHAVDYHIGSTRVVCNPGGYPEEKVAGFNNCFVLDLP